MEDFQLFRRDIFRQAGVPSLVGLQHFGIDVQHLLRGMYLVLSPVLLVGDAGDVLASVLLLRISALASWYFVRRGEWQMFSTKA